MPTADQDEGEDEVEVTRHSTSPGELLQAEAHSLGTPQVCEVYHIDIGPRLTMNYRRNEARCRRVGPRIRRPWRPFV